MNRKKKGMILAVLAIMTGFVLTLGGCGQSAASPGGEAGIEDSTQTQVVFTSENRVMAAGTALSEGPGKAQTEKQEENLMRITVGDRVLTAVLADNSSAEALKGILTSGPLTIDMSDYGNMEKVGPIGQSLPTNDEQITTGPGDIILYMGNSLVIYYDTNSWNLTRLGKIQDVTQAELKEILGNGSVTVTLSLEEEREMKGNVTEVKNGYDFKAANPELEGIMNHFIEEEVKVRNDLLTEREKQLISLVSLICQQSGEMLKAQTEQALAAGVMPVEIKEAVYHCSPYVGFPRAVDAAVLVDQVFLEQGVGLPLEPQAEVTEETRFEKGLNAQATIFGEVMRRAAAGGPEHMPASSYYLVTNCFGDYYTRGGLDLKTREMLTLSMLVNLGTESQIRSHISGNVNMGRDKAFLSQVLYQCLPYTGYPRLLNAISCLNEVIPDTEAN